MLNQYLIPPAQAIKEGRPMIHRERLDKNLRVHLTPSLRRFCLDELKENPKRYATRNSPASFSELGRSALIVFFRLKEHDPKLFEELRDQ